MRSRKHESKHRLFPRGWNEPRPDTAKYFLPCLGSFPRFRWHWRKFRRRWSANRIRGGHAEAGKKIRDGRCVSCISHRALHLSTTSTFHPERDVWTDSVCRSINERVIRKGWKGFRILVNETRRLRLSKIFLSFFFFFIYICTKLLSLSLSRSRSRSRYIARVSTIWHARISRRFYGYEPAIKGYLRLDQLRCRYNDKDVIAAYLETELYLCVPVFTVIDKYSS